MLKTVPYTFSYLHLFFWDTGNQIFALVLLWFETGCHVALNSSCNQGGSSACDPLASTSWTLALQRYIFVSRLFIVGTWTQRLSNGRKTLYQLSDIPALGYVLIEWFWCWVFAVPCVFWILIPFQMRGLQMFSPILQVASPHVEHSLSWDFFKLLPLDSVLLGSCLRKPCPN